MPGMQLMHYGCVQADNDGAAAQAYACVISCGGLACDPGPGIHQDMLTKLVSICDQCGIVASESLLAGMAHATQQVD